MPLWCSCVILLSFGSGLYLVGAMKWPPGIDSKVMKTIKGEEKVCTISSSKIQFRKKVYHFHRKIANRLDTFQTTTSIQKLAPTHVTNTTKCLSLHTPSNTTAPRPTWVTSQERQLHPNSVHRHTLHTLVCLKRSAIE